MAKTKISEYSSTPSNNTDVNGINIAEGCAPSGINNAIRQVMADLKDFQTGAKGDPLTVGGNLAVTGTGAFTGDLTAPTQTTTDSSTKVATTAFVAAKIAASTSGLSDPGGAGIVARTATAGATVARTITQGTGITVTNGDGVAGNPTIALSGSVVTTYNGSGGAVTGVSSVDGSSGSSGAVTLSSLTSFAKNLGSASPSNGHQKLPGGLIINWGYVSGTGTKTITFGNTPNAAFPTACFSFVATQSAASGSAPLSNAVTVTALDKTTATVVPGGSASGFYWVAIGV